MSVRGHSQFTFTPFCKFLTTHLPLVYNHLHSTDHLPICKGLHMSVDHPPQYVPDFSHANCDIQGLIHKLFSNRWCKIQNCHVRFKVRDNFKKGRVDVKTQSEMLKKKDYKRSIFEKKI